MDDKEGEILKQGIDEFSREFYDLADTLAHRRFGVSYLEPISKPCLNSLNYKIT